MILLRLPADTPEAVIGQVKLAAKRFPGKHALHLLIPTGRGLRRLTLGDDWRYEPSAACLAALSEFGVTKVVP